ncbi:MAG: hypothetical protein K2G52_08680 [Muribaculaceae bacterium]|nr:hypothetical protein [Muribaculaceae bacterium]
MGKKLIFVIVAAAMAVVSEAHPLTDVFLSIGTSDENESIMYSDMSSPEDIDEPVSAKAVSSGQPDNRQNKAVEELAVFELFGDKYKRKKGCSLTVVDGVNTRFRNLEVSGDPEIIKNIKRLVEMDRQKATSVTENYTEKTDEIIISFPGVCTIGFTNYTKRDKCEIFISWNVK